MRAKFNRKAIAVLIALCFFLSLVIPASAPQTALAAENTFTARDLAGKAIEFIRNQYRAGTFQPEKDFDGLYAPYVLTLAGENLAAEQWTGNPAWTKETRTMKNRIEMLADLLGSENTLISFILATQNTDGTFGPFGNEYGTKAPLQALAMIKPDLPVGESVYNQVQNSIGRAIKYFQEGYRSGRLTYDANGWNFDYRCVAALAEAGEDLSTADWVYEGNSLKNIVIASANAAAAAAENPDPSGSVPDAVYLAKHLTVLRAVYPESDKINTLAGAILNQKNTTVDEVYFGDSIYGDVTVLIALGKTGKLSGIDQGKAFQYLKKFKHEHKNAWGIPCGAAWGGYDPEEPDLTAQVLTALSYFEEAKRVNSAVYEAIQDGLKYLLDIQDADTGAIPARWDSTFATAETLIALKTLGKTFAEYAGKSSSWTKQSKTKTIAQCLLAISKWNDPGRVKKLADLLIARHSANGFDGNIFSDVWAYLALGEAGKIRELNTRKAKEYLLFRQSVAADTYGAWDRDWADFMATCQALRALAYLQELPEHKSDSEIQAAIRNGLAYLQKWQQEDGGVYKNTPPYPDDPVVDTAELIVTLNKLGQDPAGWKNARGLSPVDYMMKNALNDDGTFGACKNVLAATEALSAFLLLGNLPGGGAPGSGTTPGQTECSVGIAVVGMNGESLYGPAYITVTKENKWGLTAMGALHVTGLDYKDENGFVKEIAGQANRGMKGWMYKVNETVPMVLAKDYVIKNGDRIIWWYSTDMNLPGPTWDSLLKGPASSPAATAIPVNLPELNEKLAAELQASPEALAELEKIQQSFALKEQASNLGPVEEITRGVIITGNRQPLDMAAIAALKKELVQNEIKLSQKVTAAQGAIVTAAQAEMVLVIPAKAVKSDLEITVQKILPPPAGEKDGTSTRRTFVAPAGYRQITPVYNFGPDGTAFDEPVTLYLRIAIPPLVRPENLVLAWYDKASGQWQVIPAVVDLSKGLILARLKHFSDFAVFAREERKSFADVTPGSFGWARDTIETLAGAGIVAGVDGTRFEPGRPVTRAEFASLLVKALHLQGKADATIPFKDVKKGDWFSEAVAAAAEAGLVKGYVDNTFRPEKSITREEAAAVLVRTLNLPATTEQQIAFQDQAKVSSWARTSVAAAAAHGLVKGFPDGTFRPAATATRAECAALIYRLLAIE